ncbi:MAG: HAMP domain-containing histidine kinase [Bdellovibrionales bacterium]|nr:HAMP domain-containing histidine kinase [Bdellovibrionales bacterium]
MIRLRNLVLFELLSILLLCTGIGAVLYISDLSSFWRERYSRDAGIIRQLFNYHRNEILNGNTRGFESSMASIANLYDIRATEIDYRVTGKVVQITRDLSNRISPDLAAMKCRKPDSRILSFGKDICFYTDYGWSDEVGAKPILTLRWWVLPQGLERQKQSALLVFSVVLLLGLLFCGLHWLLINKVIVRPVSQAVARFDRWVRQESRLEPVTINKKNTPRELADLIGHFDQLLTVAEDYRNMRDLTIQLEAVELIARQVTHDLRSPLSALKLAVDKLSQSPSPEARALALKAFQRLNEILATLGQNGSRLPMRNTAELVVPSTRVENLFFLVEPVVAEHGLQVDPDKIEVRLLCDDSAEIYSCVDPVNLRRALSNLLTNAIEALPGRRGHVLVNLVVNKGCAEISVTDNGCGIPAHVLERLGQKGLTHGKEGQDGCGSGLGVYQAMHAVSECAGTLKFQTSEGEGTTVMMRLPLSEAPAFWCHELPFAPRVVVVDDEITTHRAWREKYAALPCDLVTFLSGTEFEDWYSKSKDDGIHTAYLFDFSLGQHQPTGFELVTRLEIPAEKVVIVTGMAENPEIQIQAERLSVRLMHKRYIPSRIVKVPVHLVRDESESATHSI